MLSGIPKLFRMMGYNGTNWRPVRTDAATRSLQTITYEHHEIHSGSHFFLSGFADLPSGDVMDFTLLTPDTAVWLHMAFTIHTESEVEWHVYEGATATNPLATLLTPRNSDRNSGNTSVAVVRYEVQADLATANADTSVGGAVDLLSGISGASKDSGVVSRQSEIILKQDTLYCMRGIANAAGNLSFDMQWYEHTNKDA